ncbi:hypothetical protein MNBD_ALPHA12-882 [hydrothermal vent metagenome]|uniref:Uncharacterized protein n=1 Tax=hydrothermal vent metagenome TaxID=652676 RepID=A0A3B0U9K9_9ZZZZ
MNMLDLFRPTRFFNLAGADAKNAVRDPVLLYVIILSVLPSLIIFFWRRQIETALGMPGVTALALPTILTISAFMVGWIPGFLILEERDDGPLLAIEVTPMGKRGFELYRLVLTWVLSALITLFSIELLAPSMGWGMRFFYAFVIGLEAVSVALVIPTFSSNKVAGLAMAKFTNMFALFPALALFPSPWRYLGAVFPTYWIGESFQFTPFQYLSLPLILMIALALHIALVLLLYGLFVRRVG